MFSACSKISLEKSYLTALDCFLLLTINILTLHKTDAELWKSNNTKACAKKLFQILANDIDNEGRGIFLKIYVKYCMHFNIDLFKYVCFLSGHEVLKGQPLKSLSLHEKCPYSAFFWSVFSLIRTEYREIRISPNAEKYGREKLRIPTLLT